MYIVYISYIITFDYLNAIRYSNAQVPNSLKNFMPCIIISVFDLITQKAFIRKNNIGK